MFKINKKILIVEDDPVGRALLAGAFTADGYEVFENDTGEGVIECVQTHQIPLVLLDIKLPEQDGLTLTRELRSCSNIGIIIVTCKTEPDERLAGLELGADHYETKPPNIKELIFRARTLLLRVASMNTELDSGETTVYHFDDWTYNVATRQLCSPNGEYIDIQKSEGRLLQVFLENKDKVLSREKLMYLAHNREWHPSDRIIDVRISHLRKKFKDYSESADYIQTIHGVGYMFNVREQT